MLLAFTALRLALTREYDAVHSHEEGGGIGVVLAWWLGRAAPLRHALEPAAAGGQLRVPRRAGGSRPCCGWLERLMIRRLAMRSS